MKRCQCFSCQSSKDGVIFISFPILEQIHQLGNQDCRLRLTLAFWRLEFCLVEADLIFAYEAADLH